MHDFSRNGMAMLALCAALAGCGGGDGSTLGPVSAAADTTVISVASAASAALPACPAPANPLRDVTAVQGAGALSPLVGQLVTVRGVVTGDFQPDNKLKGFFIQQPVPDQDAKTSEGIFVYAPANAAPVALGQYVQVSGTVEEFKSGSTDPERVTQIAQMTRVEVCGTGPVISPRPLTLPLANLADLESLEGMLVELAQPMTVTENRNLGRFGEIALSASGRLYEPYNHPTITDPAAVADLNNRSKIILDDGAALSNPNPIPDLSSADTSGTRRVGDTVTGVRGIVTWAFDAWRIQPVQTPIFSPANPRPAAPAAVGGTLRAGSLNVLNYFTTLGSRGASTAAELVRQRDKLVTTIAGLNADVLGLMEIENNPTTSIGDLVAAVNAKMGANTYALVNSGKPGTDLIKVAIIYKPAKVKLIGNAMVPTDPDFSVNGGLRPPVAQRFAALDNNGSFWMVVNHLKSKGSCPTSADSVDADHGQGCWNASRVRQAKALNNWVAGLASASGEADVLMVGDYNAYLNEDPIKAIEAAGFEDLLKRLPAADRYSYVFDGQSGALDHGIASNAFGSQINGVTVWHVNADEPSVLDYNTEFKPDDRYAVTPFRSSDHDPVLVGLTLNADAAVSAPTLSATLPTAAQAGTATLITGISAMPSTGAASGTLTINWGDGNGAQALPLNATSASNTYAVAGTYALQLLLTDSAGKSVAKSGSVTVTTSAPPSGNALFFSEYVEGSSNNKALEIYNPGNTAVDVSAYSVKLYANGGTIPTNTQLLTGMILPGATLTLVNSAFSTTAAISGNKVVSSAANFNGNDALTLEKNSIVIDAIGQVGFDPGTAWTSGTVTTLNKTLRRKAAITGGSTPPVRPATWDVSLEWDAFPMDTFDGLGAR